MKDFGETKVNQLDISLFVDHHVFRFYISVYHIVSRQCLQRTKYLRAVKLDPALLPIFAELHVHLILDHPVKVLARKILENKVYVFVV